MQELELSQLEWLRMAAGVSSTHSESAVSAAAARANKLWRYHQQGGSEESKKITKKAPARRKAAPCVLLLVMHFARISWRGM